MPANGRRDYNLAINRLIMRLAYISMANINLTHSVLSFCTVWCSGFDRKFLRNLEDGGMFL